MTPPVQASAIDLALGVDESVASGASAEVHEAVLLLFDECRDGTHRYVRSFGIAESDSEDVVQDVFLALFRHLKRGGARTNLRGWIFRVAHNLALKRRARDHRWVRVRSLNDVCPSPESTPSPEDQYAGSQRQARLLAVVSALPDRDRRCLLLRAEGLRYREIGHILGMSLGAVANALARAIARLRRADEG